MKINKNFWKNKKVLIIGSCGFKGKWLVALLTLLKAQIVGINKTKIKNTNYRFYKSDICNLNNINKIIKFEKPEIIFHLAAQPIVSESYNDPIETYNTNIFGLINILEIIRRNKFIKSSIIVTSDKCYKINPLNPNKSLSEDSPLGGNDPYSASKACGEIITRSYYNSFLKVEKKKRGISTVRAGNVIGGGDWSKDRIIPDIINSIKIKKKIKLRNPKSKRPWQYVLDVLFGYVLLAEKIYKKPLKFSDGWNFAKDYKKKSINVHELAKLMCKEFGYKRKFFISKIKFHEEKKYVISGLKSKKLLNWKPIYNHYNSINITANWYKEYLNNNISEDDLIQKYCNQYLTDLSKINKINK
tara:strand:- start:783 stop:1853 length:1071 start_codon:yes stop_codon:yes gene_type:complete